VNFERCATRAGVLRPGAGERAQADPPAEGAAQVAAAREGDRPAAERMGDAWDAGQAPLQLAEPVAAGQQLRARLQAAVRPYRTPTGLHFPGVSLLAAGRRP